MTTRKTAKIHVFDPEHEFNDITLCGKAPSPTTARIDDPAVVALSPAVCAWCRASARDIRELAARMVADATVVHLAKPTSKLLTICGRERATVSTSTVEAGAATCPVCITAANRQGLLAPHAAKPLVIHIASGDVGSKTVCGVARSTGTRTATTLRPAEATCVKCKEIVAGYAAEIEAAPLIHIAGHTALENARHSSSVMALCSSLVAKDSTVGLGNSMTATCDGCLKSESGVSPLTLRERMDIEDMARDADAGVTNVADAIEVEALRRAYYAVEEGRTEDALHELAELIRSNGGKV